MFFKARPEVAQNLVLVADLPIGDQHENALALRDSLAISRKGAQLAHGLRQRLGHLGATARIDLRQELNRLKALAIRRRDELDSLETRRRFDHVVEGVHGEAILVGERINHACQRPPRCHHFPAFHAAGAVQYEHDVARFRAPSPYPSPPQGERG